MRRIIPIAVLVIALLAPTVVQAGRPIADCPNESAAPRPGWLAVSNQVWWDRTVAGFVAEGIPVYVNGNPANGFTGAFDEFAWGAGFEGATGLYDFVRDTQWKAMDKNQDGMVCMKDRPHTPGNPAFFFNGIDNTAH